MAVPDFQSFMLPMLRMTSDGLEHPLSEFRERLAHDMAIDDGDLSDMLPSGTQTRYDNRIYWSSVYLCKAGVLARPRRGILQITDRGRQILEQKPQRITVRLLSQYPEFVRFNRAHTQPENKEEIGNGPVSTTETPEERLESSFESLNRALATELLETIKRSTPAFFEQLVVRLLVSMGYGGSMQDAGRAVGKTGDEGIDGIIKEDKLGLDNVYIQAKRWTDQPVGSKVVREFIGSLAVKKARKGVLITTSNFTQDAIDCVRNLEQRLVLIDGTTLADLLIEHDVGVTTAKTYRLKKIDHDFFEGE